MSSLTGMLPGFALMGTYSSSGDPPPPVSTITFTIAPSSTTPDTSFALEWATTNVVSLQFIANNGVDPAFNSGEITTSLDSGSYEVTSGFSVTTNILLLAGTVGGGVMTSMQTVTIS